MIRLAIVMEGRLPSPGVMGGVAEEFLDRILGENERKQKLSPTVINVWDEEAQREAGTYPHTRFVMIQRLALALPQIQRMGRVLGRLGLGLSLEGRYRMRVASALAGQHWDALWVMGPASLAEAVCKACDAPLIWQSFDGGGACDPPPRCREHWHYGIRGPEGSLPLPLCVDLERFDRAAYEKERGELRRRWNLSDGEIVLACVANDTQDWRRALDAFERMDLPQVRLLLAGLSQRDAAAREWLRLKPETGRRVAFSGPMAARTLPLCYAAADAVVFPSYPGQALWEAMASGKAVIAAAENLPEGPVCVKPEDADALAQALRSLVVDARGRESQGEKGRRIVRDWDQSACYDTIVSRLEGLYGLGAMVAPPPVRLGRDQD